MKSCVNEVLDMNGKRSCRLIAAWFAVGVACASPGIVIGQQGENAESMLEEVVVTARRREENLMETPVSVTAFSSADLQARQIEQAHQIAEATPNLTFYNTTSVGASTIAATLFIRGIGQADSVPTVQPGVGMYVDNAYISSVVGALTDILDIESIEVLRGPQGTLFGRNTIGGAILINSQKPSEEFYGYVDLTAGNFDRRQLKASVNVPFTDNFFGKFSILEKHRDGWVDTPNIPDDDGLGSDDTWAARAAFRWLPADTLTVDLSADFSHHEGDGPPRIVGVIDETKGTVAEYNNVVAPALGLPPYTYETAYVPPEEYTNLSTQYIRADADILGLSLAIGWDIEGMTFDSNTTYRNQESYEGEDIDHAPMLVQLGFLDIDSNQWSQEFKLSGVAVDDRLNWLVGLYHFEEDVLSRGPIRFPFFAIMTGAKLDNSSSAVFGQMTYDLTEKFSVTIGGRFTDEKFKSIVDDDLHFVTAVFDPTCTGACAQPTMDGFFPATDGYRVLPIPPDPNARRIIPPGVFQTSQSEFEPHINLAYDFTDNLMTYVSYSQGFKGGGFTQRIAPGRTIQAFEPEFAKAYEVGTKWSSERVNITSSMFYTDYTDLQVPVSQELGSSVDNASNAVIKGFEIEALALLTSRLQFSFGVGYLDGEYKDVSPDVEFSPDNSLPSVMDWQTNASIVYDLPVPTLSGNFVARVDHHYVDSHFTGARNEPGTLIPSYGIFNASFTYLHDSGNWQASLQGRNITDEFYTPQRDGFLQSSGFLNYVLGSPAEWAVNFRYNF